MECAVLEEVVLEYETACYGEPVLLIHGALIADSFRPLLGASELTERYRVSRQPGFA